MIVLDTTVLVYAMGSDHSLRVPCRNLIAAIAEGRIEATTTSEVIQEFVHVRARRKGREDAAALGRDYAVLLSPLVIPGDDDLDRGLSIFVDTDELGAFDSVLAAVAIAADATLVSAEAGFAAVSGLERVVPDQSGVENLLA